MKKWCLSAYPKSIQNVGDFVSSVEHKQRFLTQAVSHIMSVNGTHGFEYLNVSSQAAGFNLVLSVYVFFFFFSKPWVPLSGFI